MLGQKGAAQCLKSNPKKTAKFFIVPRDSGLFRGQPPIIIDAPEGFVFHHVNAYETDSNIILDSIFYDDFPSVGPDEDFRDIDFDNYPAGTLKRSLIDLKGKSSKLLSISDQTCEFAVVNPHYLGIKSNYSWMACTESKTGNAPLQAIKKINLDTKEELFWSAAPKGFVSEPIMVPKEDSKHEDEGYLLTLIWNGSRRGSDLIILNSKTLEEIATYELPINIPHGLHGSWANEKLV